MPIGLQERAPSISENARREARISHFPYNEASGQYLLTATTLLALILAKGIGPITSLEDRISEQTETVKDPRVLLTSEEKMYLPYAEYVTSGIYDAVMCEDAPVTSRAAVDTVFISFDNAAFDSHAESTNHQNLFERPLISERIDRLSRVSQRAQPGNLVMSSTAQLVICLAKEMSNGKPVALEARLGGSIVDPSKMLTNNEMRKWDGSFVIITGIYDGVMMSKPGWTYNQAISKSDHNEGGMD